MSQTFKHGHTRPATSAATQMPITLKGNHSSVLHDTGVDVISGMYADATAGWIVPPIEICEVVRTHRDKYAQLKQSLLVRVRMVRHGESVELLCGCTEIGHKGFILSMPCALEFGQGTACDLELFLTQDREPLPVRGTVRSVTRALGEDTIRFKVEIEFGKMTSLAQSELDAFVRAAKPQEHRPLLV